MTPLVWLITVEIVGAAIGHPYILKVEISLTTRGPVQWNFTCAFAGIDKLQSITMGRGTALDYVRPEAQAVVDDLNELDNEEYEL